ncbi:MAG: EAL domain-containing protein [Pseudomonadota bacterium]
MPTRLGRRLFLAFFVVAAVPVATIAVYTLGHYASIIRAQDQQQLEDALLAQGQLAIDRLEEIAQALVVESSAADDSKAGRDMPEGAFSEEQVAVQVLATDSGIRLRTVGAQKETAVRLDLAWLFAATSALPPRTGFCVRTLTSGAVIYCNNPVDPAVNSRRVLDRVDLEPTAQHTQQINLDGTKINVAQWELPLSSRVSGENWHIIAHRPVDYFVGAAAMRGFLPTLMVLALIVAVMIAVVTLRRLLAPLQKLMDAMHRAGESDFSEPVAVTNTRDEFFELGSSFNAMMGKLDMEMGRFRINAEIDRLILQSESVETILNLILGRAFLFIDADYLCVAVIDKSDPGMMLSQSTRASDGYISPLRRQPIGELDQDLLRTASLPVVVEPRWPHTQSMRDLGATAGIITAVDWHGQNMGFIAAGVDERELYSLSIRSQLVELRDRLAVALSAAEKEKTLFQQANYDSLTGLPNRQLLEDRLRTACQRRRGLDQPFALLFIDLDNFKLVNDSLGHSVGDQMLQKMSQRLVNHVRRSDTAARLGGDEFVLMLDDCATPEVASSRAESILESLSRTIDLDDNSIHPNASIGIAMYPADGETAGELLRNADAAMYKSKERGRGKVTFFTQQINDDVARRMEIFNRLRDAIANNELALAFQPQLNLKTGKIDGAETLLRWPGSGVSPAEFIPVAEQHGLIVEMGNWVLREACRTLSALPKNLRPKRLAVNISGRQLLSGDMTSLVLDTCASYGIDPSAIEIEITESVFLDDAEKIARELKSLRSMGIPLALDDFGTGYSSLSYLQQFPITCIKIDRSFVTSVDSNKSQQGFVRAVVDLARNLKMETVAEGAETPEEVAALRKLGCDYVQGYAISRPLQGDRALMDAMANACEIAA